jgi:hypothetical protein
MSAVEPVAGAPAAVADCGGERALVVADYHAGIERGLRYERGVELESNAALRRRRLLSLLDETGAERLVVLGDLAHRIGGPEGVEREELDRLVGAVTDRVPFTLVPGNHDGGLADALPAVEVTDGGGFRLADVGFVHGHRWPSPEVLGARVVCMGHEHPAVRLVDDVGGARVEKAWLRGPLRRDVFATYYDRDPSDLPWDDSELVVFPAFNERSGGTWINVEGQGFLSPFLPGALLDGAAEAYLLDGTRLGRYDRV